MEIRLVIIKLELIKSKLIKLEIIKSGLIYSEHIQSKLLGKIGILCQQKTNFSDGIDL